MPANSSSSREIQEIKHVGPKRAVLLRNLGFHAARDIRHNPLLFFTSIKPHYKKFVVHHHDREKIILDVFHLTDLTGIDAYKMATKRLPRNTWVSQNSIFSILSPSAKPFLRNMGVTPRLIATVQGAMLTHGIYRVAHLSRPDKQERIAKILASVMAAEK
jgi:hypothetical protein